LLKYSTVLGLPPPPFPQQTLNCGDRISGTIQAIVGNKTRTQLPSFASSRRALKYARRSRGILFKSARENFCKLNSGLVWNANCANAAEV